METNSLTIDHPRNLQIVVKGSTIGCTAASGDTCRSEDPIFVYSQDGKMVITNLNPGRHGARITEAFRFDGRLGDPKVWLPPWVVGSPLTVKFSGAWFPLEYVQKAKLWEPAAGYNTIAGRYLHYGPAAPDQGEWLEFKLQPNYAGEQIFEVEVEESGRALLSDGNYAIG